MTNGEKNVTTNAQPMVAQVFGTKIFPTAIKSNKPIISRRHYLLESLLAHLKVT